MIDEASRERFFCAYRENSGYSAIDFMKRAIVYFGYKPEALQTDNGIYAHSKDGSSPFPGPALY